MAQRLEYTVLGLVEDALRTIKASPMNLGGVGGGGGGVGGPPGGFIGQLPQYRVTYDETEAATLATLPSGVNPPSGWSLVDNLNHIRYRVRTLESGGGTSLTVQDYDGSPHITNVNEITFSGAIISNLGGGNVLVRMIGGSGGGGIEEAPIDNNTYARINGEWAQVWSIAEQLDIFVKLAGTDSGQPITGTIEIINDFDTGAGIYVQTMGDAYTGDFEQFGYSAEVVHSPTMFLYRGAGDATNVDFDSPMLSLHEDNGHGIVDDAPVFDYRYNGDIYWRFSPRQTSYNYVFNTVNNPGANTIFSVQHDLEEVFHITGSGWVYDAFGRLVSEAPINGSGYMRKNGAWVLASGGSGSGFGDNVFCIDQSAGTADTYHILGGAVNGSNAVFTTSQAKYVSGSLKVYLNGQLQTQGTNEDWVETSPSTGTFTFNTAPASTDLITAEYLVSSVATGNADTLDGIDSTGFVLKKPWFAFNEADQTFELGANVPGKIDHAGKIGYNTFGADFLYIVGAGSGVFSSNRNVKIFDNLYVDNNLYINGGQVLTAGKQVTNGDSHDHLGGDGAQIDHGSLGGLADDDHTQYVRHNLSTASNDFLVGSGSNTWIKQTLAQVITILRTSLDSVYSALGHQHTSRQVVPLHGNGATIGAGTTLYLVPALNGLVALNAAVWTVPGTIKNLYFRTNSTQPGTGAITVTMQKNVVDQAVTLTVAAGAGANTFTDTTHSFSVVAGDVIAVKAVNAASGASAAITSCAFEFQPATI